ncbi:hypothetical protein SH668x_001013 [Planctomicrobium sp. SH668]|uniref:hypothetical protein n=1 Tax=Planctomicrobium sp. SH668 TaxID=3448126 RepID=UPI003F5BF4D8
MNPAASLIVTFLARVADWVCYVFAGWAVYCIEHGDKCPWSLVKNAAATTLPYSEGLIFFGLACGFVSRILVMFIRTESAESITLNKGVCDALDDFRRSVFPKLPGKTPRDANRVTIFKHVPTVWFVMQWKGIFWPWGKAWPWSGWLVLKHRSGHTTKLSTTIFLAPDNAENAEGVAGFAWRADGAVRRRDLPQLDGIEARSIFQSTKLAWAKYRNSSAPELQIAIEHDRRVERYAKETFTSTRVVWQRIRKKKKSPISILAIPLETVDNQRWGVLVVDSANEYDCLDPEDARFRKAFLKLKKSLAKFAVTKT